MAQRKKRLAMLIDAGKCFDCKACMIACKVENQVPEGLWRNWVRHNGGPTGRRTAYQPGQCMQCAQPSCVAACPVGATYQRTDGVVAVDPKKCIGCSNCVAGCPYGARFINPVTNRADKCDFCLSRLEVGEVPACVETCPTKTRIFGDLNDPASEVAKAVKAKPITRVVAPHVDTKPMILYVAGTPLLDWAKSPTLPGGVHMPPDFWRPGA